jgi:hypothetical protein
MVAAVKQSAASCVKCGCEFRPDANARRWCDTCSWLLKVKRERPDAMTVQRLGLPLFGFDERQVDEPIPRVMKVETWPELFPLPSVANRRSNPIL